MAATTHEMIRVDTDLYVCTFCGYRGNLSKAVEHAVKNQFVVNEESNVPIERFYEDEIDNFASS